MRVRCLCGYGVVHVSTIMACCCAASAFTDGLGLVYSCYILISLILGVGTVRIVSAMLS